MRKILMGTVALMCLLTGCQQAPEQVKERMNSSGANEEKGLYILRYVY